jgi:hypothetical protein
VGQSAWISSNPPEFGKELARPYKRGGSFEVELLIKPVIDSQTDCRIVSCAIMSRNDDTAASDRSQDLILPVTFHGNNASSSTGSAGQVRGSASAAPSDDGGSGLLGWAAIGLLVVGALGAGGFGLYRYQQARS